MEEEYHFPVASSSHTLLIDISNQLWVAGSNLYGQIGLSKDVQKISHAEMVPDLPRVTRVAVSYENFGSHSLVVDDEGYVWGAGWNVHGQLGLGNTNQQFFFTQIPQLTEITFISCGGHHSMMVNNQGRVWACGANSDGQLGIGNTSSRTSPTPVLINYDTYRIKSVVCGSRHSILLDDVGRVHVVGGNGYGQLGFGETKYLFPTIVTTLEGVNIVSASTWRHTILLDDTGKVRVTGNNEYGQLGVNGNVTKYQILEDLPQIVAASNGANHSLFVAVDGEVWVCGRNNSSQLGLGHHEHVYKPEKIPNLPRIINAFAGNVHSIMEDELGQVWAVGHNVFGQLATGDEEIITIPTIITDIPKVWSSTHAYTAVKSARK